MEVHESQPDQPIINIVGEKVALGPRRRDLIPTYLRWINDFEVTRTLSIRMAPTTREAEEAWYEGITKRENEIGFTIYEKSTLQPIGNAGLYDVDYFHRTAKFAIMIGEKECWGKGYGTETARLMLDYGFTVLGLHSIMLYAYSYNERGIRAYTRAGFKEVGRLRECHRLAGIAYDVLLMDCLATEFQSPLLHRLLPASPGGEEM